MRHLSSYLGSQDWLKGLIVGFLIFDERYNGHTGINYGNIRFFFGTAVDAATCPCSRSDVGAKLTDEKHVTSRLSNWRLDALPSHACWLNSDDDMIGPPRQVPDRRHTA